MRFNRGTRSQLLATIVMFALGMVGITRLSAQSQAFTATISGTVTDTSGGVVPGAKVTLTSAERGIARSFTTSDSGAYSFTLLPPADYVLKVEQSGFQTYEQRGVSLAAGVSAHQDITLSVGAVNQEVIVSAAAPLLNADNANISADISQRQVVELPLNLRNVFGLASLNSSVNNSTQAQMVNSNGISGSADQDISFLNFGGTHFGTAAYLFDGTWNTAQDWGGVVYVPSVENVQEFKIQTNAFTAQYGWSSGNVVNVVSKSGTNRFHGDVFEFYRNSSLDANNYFSNRNGLKRPDFSRHQFGGSAGGPLYIPGLYKQTEKTFIFGVYEGLRQSTPAQLTATVPTAGFLGGDFSSLLTGQVAVDQNGAPVKDALGRTVYAGAIYDPYSVRAITAGQIDPRTGLVATSTGFIRDAIPGNNLAGRIDPVAAKIAAGGYWPKPTNSSLANNFFANAGANAHSDEYSIRVDHNISDLSRIFARYSHKSETKTNSPAFFGASNPGGPGVTNPNNRWSFDMGYSHIFTQSLILSANAGMNRWIEQSATQGDGFKPSALGLPTSLDPIANQFPQIKIDGYSGLGPGAINGQDSYAVPRNYITYSADLTKSLSKHTLTVGFMGVVNQILGGHVYGTKFNFITSTTAGPDPSNVTQGTGFGLASYLLGVPDNTGSTGVNAQLATQKNYFGGYFQDDWKFTPRLTVNLGLRYEVQTPLTERHDKQQYFDFTAANPIGSGLGIATPGQLVFNGSGHTRSLYDTQTTNFGPRLGISYLLKPNLVLRTGYGLFFIPTFTGNGPADGYTQTTPIRGTAGDNSVFDTLSNPVPNGILLPQGSGRGALQDVGQGVPAVRRGRSSSYLQQWMLGMQYSFRPNDMLDITYVGNRGLKLSAGTYERDMLNPQYFSMGLPALTAQVPNPFAGRITGTGCSLQAATVPAWQLLRPFPQYCSVAEQEAPLGDSYYNALQMTYTHRFSHGFSVLASYTFSKFIDNVEGNNGWANSGSTSIRNYYNLAAEKSVDGNDIPHSLVVSYIYELPVGKGKAFGSNMNTAANAILGGWQVSGISTFKQGFPLGISPANNTLGQFGGNRRPDIVADMHVSHPTIDRWFNVAAFQDPSDPFDFGSAPRYISQLRAPGYQNWDLSAQKYWHLGEVTRLQFRAELYNAFNHANFYAPNQQLGARTALPGGGYGGSFGTIGNAFAGRDVQFAGKFYW